MPKKLDFKNLRLCLNNYPTDWLFIRDCGGYESDGSYRIQGMTKVNEDLENKSLDFKKDRSGLHMFINKNEVFHFPLKDYYKGFSLAYEHIKPKRSFLGIVLDNHLMEIFFKGRINIKFHSWCEKPHFKYWTIDKSKKI